MKTKKLRELEARKLHIEELMIKHRKALARCSSPSSRDSKARLLGCLQFNLLTVQSQIDELAK